MDKNRSRTSVVAWPLVASILLLGPGAVSHGQAVQTGSQPGTMGDMMKVVPEAAA